MVLLILVLLLAQVSCASSIDVKGAIVITLAGSNKLAEYFEWSCRSIEASAELFDMLVFHESNERVLSLNCAPNVKLINLGVNGLSRLIAAKVMEVELENEDVYKDLQSALVEVMHHVPRVLVNIKPMSGYLFAQWLRGYSHWTYSDPDIVWGPLQDWLEIPDMQSFDIVTVAKVLDAGRLFIRGQFALHKNTDKVNSIYKSLEYLEKHRFTTDIATALGMVRSKKTSDEIYSQCFHSAEGWYSAAVFNSGVSVKIVGRGLDDFRKDPVIVYHNQLIRCPQSEHTLSQCIEQLHALSASSGNKSSSLSNSLHTWSAEYLQRVSALPRPVWIPITPMKDKKQCQMQWLPTTLRFWYARHSPVTTDS